MSGDWEATRESRAALVAAARLCTARGLNEGAAGNLSVRNADAVLITPTGLAPDCMEAEDMVQLSLDGDLVVGQRRPSSEWRFHCDIYRTRPGIAAIVHAHSPYATALACTRRDLPAFHYMIALAGGDSIRCAEYATFGTQALSDHVLTALQDRSACLLANHGMIAIGTSLQQALRLALEVENLARQYAISRAIGAPVLLDAAEMRRVIERFEHYGQGDVDATT